MQEHDLTPVDAARLLETYLRDTPFKLAGGYVSRDTLHSVAQAALSADHPPLGCAPVLFLQCTPNRGQSMNQAPVTTEHFIVGDFILVDTAAGDSAPTPPTPLTSEPVTATDAAGFDERMKLKEDYDFTAQHLHVHGGVCRLNRLFVKAEHYVNSGGAVAVRNGKLEKQMIKHLRTKWPGVFLDQRRKNEVILKWSARKPFVGDKIAKVCGFASVACLFYDGPQHTRSTPRNLSMTGRCTSVAWSSFWRRSTRRTQTSGMSGEADRLRVSWNSSNCSCPDMPTETRKISTFRS